MSSASMRKCCAPLARLMRAAPGGGGGGIDGGGGISAAACLPPPRLGVPPGVGDGPTTLLAPPPAGGGGGSGGVIGTSGGACGLGFVKLPGSPGVGVWVAWATATASRLACCPCKSASCWSANSKLANVFRCRRLGKVMRPLSSWKSATKSSNSSLRLRPRSACCLRLILCLCTEGSE